MVGASPITREIFNGNVNVDDDVAYKRNHSNDRYVTSVNVSDAVQA